MTLLSETPTAVELLGAPEPFFRLLTVNAEDATGAPTALQQLRDRELTGVLVRSVYDAGTIADVASRLQRHDPPFLKTSFPEEFCSWFYGRNLNLMGTDPITYFLQAKEFASQMRDLFPRGESPAERLFAVLSQLDDGRVYRAAPGPDAGQDYMPLTFRCHEEGGHIPAHCDNEQSVRPAFDHLRTLVADQMYSMVLMIQAPVSGGALEVFDSCVESPEPGGNVGAYAGRRDVSHLSSVQIASEPGDVLLIDSGRFLHRVTPVSGGRPRWVACSFMAPSLERRAVYCWG